MKGDALPRGGMKSNYTRMSIFGTFCGLNRILVFRSTLILGVCLEASFGFTSLGTLAFRTGGEIIGPFDICRGTFYPFF